MTHQSRRFAILAERDINKETFVEPWPEAGLAVADSPLDPRPSLRVESGRVVELDGRPRAEFDIRRQMNKAVISIPSNVAEGWKRKRRRGAYQNHVSIAMGSHAELETQLEVCFRNGFLRRERCNAAWALLIRVGHVLEALHDSLD